MTDKIIIVTVREWTSKIDLIIDVFFELQIVDTLLKPQITRLIKYDFPKS